MSELSYFSRRALSRRGLLQAAGAATFFSPFVARAQVRQPIMMYSAADDELQAAVVRAFEAKHPQYEVKSVNGSNGPIAARTTAERSNPQADVVFSINSFYLEQLKRDGALQPYAPRSTEIPQRFRDGDDFFFSTWITINGFLVNRRVAENRQVAAPRTWEALAGAAYRGQVSVASPVRSGTGLTIFTALVDAFGWEYLDRLHPNMASYQSGGGAAGVQAARGEIMIGITYDSVLMAQLRTGAPCDMIFPDMVPNVTEGGGLVANGPNPAGGRLFIDYIASREGAGVYKPFVGSSTTPGVGNIDIATLPLWTMRRPVNLDEFRREWARRYER